MKWSPVTMGVRTTIIDNFNISVNSSFSLYGLDSNGRPINTFAFEQNNKLMRLTNFNTGLDFSLSDLLSRGKDKENTNTNTNSNTNSSQDMFNTGFDASDGMASNQPAQKNSGEDLRDEYGYMTFDVPWSLNLNYSFNYSKPGLTSYITQTLALNGNVTVTKKMSMNFFSGYDFKAKEITMTSIGIHRDLHCWEMNLNWIPVGNLKGWNFTIRAKASVLGDLKYERKKDYHDSY